MLIVKIATTIIREYGHFMKYILPAILGLLSAVLSVLAYYYDSNLLRSIAIVGVGTMVYPLYLLVGQQLDLGRGWVLRSTLITESGVVLSCLIYLSLLWMDGKL